MPDTRSAGSFQFRFTTFFIAVVAVVVVVVVVVVVAGGGGGGIVVFVCVAAGTFLTRIGGTNTTQSRTNKLK